MLSDPDAARVAKAIAVNFAQIARCEQDLHAIRRAEAKTEDPDLLLAALEKDRLSIDANVERIEITDDSIVDVHRMRIYDLLDLIHKVPEPTLSCKKEPDTIVKFLATLIVRAQLFDSWLEPTVSMDMSRTKEHESFHFAFETDGHVLLDDGAVIFPRRRQSWRTDDVSTESVGIFARHLRNLAYIPSQLDSDNPDKLTSPGNPVSGSYKLWYSSTLIGKPVPRNPIIAIAPLAERGGDVAFAPSKCRSKYALQLNYDETRFTQALRRALDEGVHILLVPEMALPEGDPDTFDDRMGQLIIDAQAEYLARNGHPGQLRLIAAGVLGGERHDNVHENYAVVFDANGDQPDEFRQLKLSHWNLTKTEQDRFGVTYYQARHQPLKDPISENSRVAERLSVLDIPGVGRTAILICADMSQNNPGDWLSINAVLDWLYAPIMDKSTCWEISDERNSPRPWIVQRTYRSARLTGTLVITTNSMALTRWVNEANRRAKSDWPQYKNAGIGLAIDGRRNPPTHCHVAVNVDQKGVLELFSNPEDDWEQFPLPSNPSSG